MVSWIKTSPEDAWKLPTENVLGELTELARVPDDDARHSII